jgi:hypothetical protein
MLPLYLQWPGKCANTEIVPQAWRNSEQISLISCRIYDIFVGGNIFWLNLLIQESQGILNNFSRKCGKIPERGFPDEMPVVVSLLPCCSVSVFFLRAKSHGWSIHLTDSYFTLYPPCFSPPRWSCPIPFPLLHSVIALWIWCLQCRFNQRYMG